MKWGPIAEFECRLSRLHGPLFPRDCFLNRQQTVVATCFDDNELCLHDKSRYTHSLLCIMVPER